MIVNCIFISACSEKKLITYDLKKAQNSNIDSSSYKVGNPYQVDDVWYYPSVNYKYKEIGIASWYGSNFNGKYTANGEVFDQNKVTAAHRTLPMPCYVHVTNLENGRSIVVRVNDRGPFSRDRIIDLSRRSAQLLDIEQSGMAKVKLKIMATESRDLALKLNTKKIDNKQLTFQQQQKKSIKSNQIFIQIATLKDLNNANKVNASLSLIGKTKIIRISTKSGNMFRVHIGPLFNLNIAYTTLKKIITLGYSDAKLIMN
ncbi:MAG: septal ring lytic transglycosylase RlpA family protein [Rhodospirillaceae bacterium]|jgi:rare lipoprotein A|nr:septal ring lytic transglycosylase RlpA family protein [Rhodospirillaceae bacterium]